MLVPETHVADRALREQVIGLTEAAEKESSIQSLEGEDEEFARGQN